MRILYFSRDYTPHDHRFLTELAKTGHEVFFLRLEQGSHALEDRPLPPQIEQVLWEGGQKPAGFRDGPRMLAALRRVIDRVRPDLVHAGPIQRCGLLAAVSGFHPLVTMSWGYDLIFDAPKNVWWRWATSYTLKHSDVMVGDCDTIRQLAVTYGMKADRIVTFPWGIDLAHFNPGESVPAVPGQPITLLSTRNWEPIYGIEVIARAFIQSVAHNPNLRLVMLSNGSQAPILRQIFATAHVDDLVSFPGQISFAGLPEYYRSANLYISASHSDGTSISLLEALACGAPALVSDIPGNLEWIVPGQNGWVFKDGDASAMSQAILQAAADPGRLFQMRQFARQTAERRADWQKNFQQLLVAYDMALHTHNSRRKN